MRPCHGASAAQNDFLPVNAPDRTGGSKSSPPQEIGETFVDRSRRIRSGTSDSSDHRPSTLCSGLSTLAVPYLVKRPLGATSLDKQRPRSLAQSPATTARVGMFSLCAGVVASR